MNWQIMEADYRSNLEWLKKPQYAGQQPPNYENNCNNKRYMDKPAQSAEKNETQQPQNKDNNCNY